MGTLVESRTIGIFSLSDINYHGNLKYILLLIYAKNLEKKLTIQNNRYINI